MIARNTCSPSREIAAHDHRNAQSGALLMGKIYDDRAHRMWPSHVSKSGKKYRYYLSTALVQGQASNAGSVSRIPAEAVEAIVVKSLRDHLRLADPIDDRALIDAYVQRINVDPEQLSLTLAQPATPGRRQPKTPRVLRIPWRKPPSKLRRELLRPATPQHQTRRPIRAEARATLVAAIARGRQWLNELLTHSDTTVDLIAAREHCTPQDQHDDLARLPRAGSRQGRARRPAPGRHWHRMARRYACRVASAISGPRPRDSLDSFGATPPSSMKVTSAPIAIGETGICRQRIGPRNRAIR